MTLMLLLAALAAASPADPAAADSARTPLRLVPRGAVVESTGSAIRLDPAGIAVDGFGRVFVSDATQHRLERRDSSGVLLDTQGSLGSEPGQLRRPGAVTRLGTLGVAVLDRENRRVVAYDLHGRLIGVPIRFDDEALERELGRIDAVALAADRGGALYVADAERDRILAFDFAGTFTATLGGPGGKPGTFRGVRGLAVAPRGQLVVAERGNARVQRLEAGGQPAAAWPLPVGPGLATLGVAVDDSGRVAVCDEPTGRLWLFSADGAVLARLDGLGAPRAVAFTGRGELLVAEARPGRVRRFAIEAAASPE